MNKEAVEIATHLSMLTKHKARIINNEFVILHIHCRLSEYRAMGFWIRDNTKQRWTLKWRNYSMTFENGERIE